MSARALFFISELMKCSTCVSDLAELKIVLDESDSAPNVSEEQQQSNETSQEIKKKKKNKRKLHGAGDAASSEYLIVL